MRIGAKRNLSGPSARLAGFPVSLRGVEGFLVAVAVTLPIY